MQEETIQSRFIEWTVKHGCNPQQIEMLLSTHPKTDDYIEAFEIYCENRFKFGDIDNKKSFIMQGIRKGYNISKTIDKMNKRKWHKQKQQKMAKDLKQYRLEYMEKVKQQQQNKLEKLQKGEEINPTPKPAIDFEKWKEENQELVLKFKQKANEMIDLNIDRDSNIYKSLETMYVNNLIKERIEL